MAEIEIGEERETSHGWSYDVAVFDQGKTYRHTVTLSWADYDLWSGGSTPPSRVLHRLFTFLLDHEPADAILTRFDGSVVRRYFPQVDAWMKNSRPGDHADSTT